jgi:hypothetical protein
MAKYALTNNSDEVFYIFEADSLEAAEVVASIMYGTNETILADDKENSDKVAIGCTWDGSKFIPIPGTELDELHPTTWGPEESAPE